MYLNPGLFRYEDVTATSGRRKTSPCSFNIETGGGGGRKAPMYSFPAVNAGIKCGSVREERDAAAETQVRKGGGGT